MCKEKGMEEHNTKLNSSYLQRAEFGNWRKTFSFFFINLYKN